MMYLQNDLIEAVPLDRTLVSKPGYLGKIKRGLKEKYQLLLQESSAVAEFLVIDTEISKPDIDGALA